MKLTDWIGGKHKPVRAGVYERLFRETSTRIFTYWTGCQWLCNACTKDSAANQLVPSYAQDLPWRGLAEKP